MTYKYSSEPPAEKVPDSTVSAMELGGRTHIVLEDLPTVVRLAVKCNAGAGGCCVMLTLIGNLANAASCLFPEGDRKPSGIGFAALAFVSNVGYLTGPNYAKSPLLLLSCMPRRARRQQVSSSSPPFFFQPSSCL